MHIIYIITFLFTFLKGNPLTTHQNLLNAKLTASSHISNDDYPSYNNNGDYGDFDYNYMIYLVNREREIVGSRPLTYNHKLNRAAQLHSEYQAQVGRMSHSGIYGSSPFERIRNTGYRSSGEAENVAYNQQSVEEVVNTWANSPGHYRNMVNPEFTEMGAGMADYYWTQTFGCGDYNY